MFWWGVILFSRQGRSVVLLFVCFVFVLGAGGGGGVDSFVLFMVDLVVRFYLDVVHLLCCSLFPSLF